MYQPIYLNEPVYGEKTAVYQEPTPPEHAAKVEFVPSSLTSIKPIEWKGVNPMLLDPNPTLLKISGGVRLLLAVVVLLLLLNLPLLCQWPIKSTSASCAVTLVTTFSLLLLIYNIPRFMERVYPPAYL